ncbi:MAG: glycosyltransferase [Rhizobiales bacterium]|nr:glycosyltransferase [Hyphomicrobiales bacterium]
MIAPRLARQLSAAWLGRDAPEGITRMSFRDLWRLHSRKSGAKAPIWHARRNNEMMAGLLLRLFGWRFSLVFTSAGQRHHTWITRFLIARMDGVIATSETSASFLKRRATVIHHGVDTALYCPPPDRGKAFAATGLPGKFAIGCFGRVRAQKGTDVFVAAVCELLPKFPDFTALILGPIDDRAFLAGLRGRIDAAGLTDRVRIFGELPIADVPPWYQRILIYAFTSRVEGFGLTMLEAMAAGAALVAARAGAADKVVSVGETGILVPPGDVGALVRALEPLMRNPDRAAEMGKRARQRVIEEFSADAEACQIVDFYRRVWAGTA